MPIDWLPYVDNCCICIKNSNIAVLLIGFYSILFRGLLCSYPMVSPLCKNADRSGGLALFEFILAILLLLCGIAFTIGAILLLTKILMDFGTTDVYVYSVFVLVPLTVFYWVIYVVLFTATLKRVCVMARSDADAILPYTSLEQLNSNTTYSMSVPIRGILYGSLMGSAIEGLLLLYFAIVVNSYNYEMA